ncbi:MAG: putative ATP-dependent dsDNA exonuclease, partial [Blastococcus sp.]|nr:putative ATP-dependent dsDNA exonuclease [Blastococcus sp.]
MRLHRLSVTAFGPFAGTEEVDLDEVGRDGLFLLWGPTGAGKTTLLDAVVFALYGTVPGARGEVKRLRSDHADTATRTEVRCELTLAGERLLVVRRPEQQRPKKRGEGWTTEQAKLTVQRMTDGGWEPVSTRIDEGSEHLHHRLGLDVHQFCQVVLLPQGDFARFLRAEPEHRAELLGTLFDVGRFARAEDWLAEERSAARERMAVHRARLSTLLARVAQIADAEVPEDLAPELVGGGLGNHVDPWVERIRTTAAERLAQAEASARTAATAVGVVDAELAAARALDERHARRDRAVRELDALTAREPELAPLRAERDGGRRAEGLRDVLEAAARAALAAEQADAAHRTARTAWAAVSEGRVGTLDLARVLRDEAAAARA